jgi:acyl-coenzyme A synthetase/AMP-(fatty) acid ligase
MPDGEKRNCMSAYKPRIDWVEGRDEWWHLLIRNASKKHEAVEMDAEDPLIHFIHVRINR